jgi:Putative zinc-finger
MTECDKFKALYSGYIEGELFPDQIKSLEAHLSLCPPCQRAVERLKTICRTLRRLPILTTSPDFESRLHQQIAHLANGNSMRLSLPINNWKIPAFASAAVIVIVGIFLTLNSPSNRSTIDMPSRSVISPVNPQKSSGEEVLTNQESNEGSSKAAAGLPNDSLGKDTDKGNREDGLKLVDDKK